MKGFLYSLLAAFGLTFVPLIILRLPFSLGVVSFLKAVSEKILAPGTYIDILLAGEKYFSITSPISDLANFVFYALIIYAVVELWHLYFPTSRKTQSPTSSR